MSPHTNPTRCLFIVPFFALAFGVTGCAHVETLADEFRAAAEASDESADSESSSSDVVTGPAVSLDEDFTAEVTTDGEDPEYRIEVPANRYFALYTSLDDSSPVSTTLFLDVDGALRIPEQEDELNLAGKGRGGRHNFGPYEPQDADRTYVLRVRGDDATFDVRVADALGEAIEYDGGPLHGTRHSLETVKVHDITTSAPAGTPIQLEFKNQADGAQNAGPQLWDPETDQIYSFLMRPVSRGSSATWCFEVPEGERAYRFILTGVPGPYEVEARPTEVCPGGE